MHEGPTVLARLMHDIFRGLVTSLILHVNFNV